jgi:Ankyrin repeats (many copies)
VRETTTLVLHRSADLAALLEKAKTAALVPLKRYLAAGGSPDVLVDLRAGVIPGPVQLAPLLWLAIACHHVKSHEGSIKALLDANANLDAVYIDNDSGEHETVLMCACLTGFTKVVTWCKKQQGVCTQHHNKGAKPIDVVLSREGKPSSRC